VQHRISGSAQLVREVEEIAARDHLLGEEMRGDLVSRLGPCGGRKRYGVEAGSVGSEPLHLLFDQRPNARQVVARRGVPGGFLARLFVIVIRHIDMLPSAYVRRSACARRALAGMYGDLYGVACPYGRSTSVHVAKQDASVTSVTGRAHRIAHARG